MPPTELSVKVISLPFVMTIRARVAEVIDLGRSADGWRRMVPIVDGTVAGPEINGEIMPGGADFQLVHADDFTTMQARYVLRMSSGELVYVENNGMRSGSPEAMARLAQGQEVLPSEIYFRSSPRFETSALNFKWLTRSMFVGVGERHPSYVKIDVYRVP